MHGPKGRRGVGVLVVCLLCAVAVLPSAVAATFVGNGLSGQQGVRPVCKGLHKAEVDWWVMLKHPGGYRYTYVDSVSSSAASCAAGLCWRHGLSMQNPNPVSHTLEVLATPPTAAAADSLAHVIYNDADPGGTEHFDSAHAKGVVAFTQTAAPAGSSGSSNSSIAEGFWLVHSAPRFPHLPGEPGWTQLQRPQSVFGQHFSCFSLLGNTSIAAVADALVAAGPYVFSSKLPASLAVLYPGWLQVVAGAFERRPTAVDASLTTSAGQQLLVFAKSSLLNVSLTDAVVGPGLGVSMYWETWRRSHDALPSACPNSHPAAHSSLNVAQVSFPHTQYTWSWDRDHSKWGVSSSNAASNDTELFVCLGDMNRAGWQAHRGGGYVCVQHIGLWHAFHGLLAAAEPCVWRV